MPGYGESRRTVFLRRDFMAHLKIVEVGWRLESAFVSGIPVEQVGLSGSPYRKKLQSVFPVNTS
jgi:hypothetical protein